MRLHVLRVTLGIPLCSHLQRSTIRCKLPQRSTFRCWSRSLTLNSIALVSCCSVLLRMCTYLLTQRHTLRCLLAQVHTYTRRSTSNAAGSLFSLQRHNSARAHTHQTPTHQHSVVPVIAVASQLRKCTSHHGPSTTIHTNTSTTPHIATTATTTFPLRRQLL